MRERKFRVFNPKTNEMLYSNEAPNLHDFFFAVHVTNQINENPVPLMDFTGLKDKNGTEIYEGDLVKRRILEDGVNWLDLTCEVRWMKWCYGLYIHDKYITCLDILVANGLEVIGNIYEPAPGTINP